MAFIPKHFAYEAPRFGRSAARKSTEPYKNSVYYLWWEFLRLSDTYRKCCENAGKGKLSKLYSDFGDVHSVDFKTWWTQNDKGARLFAEKHLQATFGVVERSSDLHFQPNVVYLRVPLSLSKRTLKKNFLEILNGLHAGRAGKKNITASTAKYPISGHVDTSALQKYLAVYKMRRENPSMTLWQIAQKCKVAERKNFISDNGTETKAEITNKKQILSSTANRLYQKAVKIVKHVELGKFAVVS